MNYIIGIASNGERLRFERWVYDSWRAGELRNLQTKTYCGHCAGVSYSTLAFDARATRHRHALEISG